MNVSVERVVREAIELMSGHKMTKDVVIQHLVNRYDSKPNSDSPKPTAPSIWVPNKKRKVSDTYNISIPRTNGQSTESVQQAVPLLRRMKTLKNHQAITMSQAAMVLGTTHDSLRRRVGRAVKDGIHNPFKLVSITKGCKGTERYETSGVALFTWAEQERSRGRNMTWRLNAEAYSFAATYLN